MKKIIGVLLVTLSGVLAVGLFSSLSISASSGKTVSATPTPAPSPTPDKYWCECTYIYIDGFSGKRFENTIKVGIPASGDCTDANTPWETRPDGTKTRVIDCTKVGRF